MVSQNRRRCLEGSPLSKAGVHISLKNVYLNPLDGKEVCWLDCQSWYAVTRHTGMNPLGCRQGCQATAGGQCMGMQQEWATRLPEAQGELVSNGEKCEGGRSPALRRLWETPWGGVNTNNQGASANRKPGTQSVHMERAAGR